MEVHTNSELFVITGGPGMGKTSLIQELAQAGYYCVAESGRKIIQTQLETGGDQLPWANRSAYAMEMFRMAVADYERASKNGALSFFDRGIPDVIGYLRLCELSIPEAYWTAAQTLRYHKQVFITPPWPEIYLNDKERKQSLEEAEATFDVMMDVYQELDYSLIEIPKLSIKERVRFILQHVKSFKNA